MAAVLAIHQARSRLRGNIARCVLTCANRRPRALKRRHEGRCPIGIPRSMSSTICCASIPELSAVTRASRHQA